MLHKIAEISGVGPYVDCRPAAIKFGKLTLIFGGNGLGKSTLAEILRTLETSDANPIFERRTLPRVDAPIIRLHIGGPDCEEKTLCFCGDNWRQPVPYNFAFAVFDASYAAQSIQSVESAGDGDITQLSRLIVGDTGVDKATTILRYKALLDSKSTELDALETAFQGIENLGNFLAMRVTESDAELVLKIRGAESLEDTLLEGLIEHGIGASVNAVADVLDRITATRLKIERLEKRRKRLALTRVCEAYIKLSREIDYLRSRALHKEQRLLKQQSNYLEHHFHRISANLSKFGSQDFSFALNTKLDESTGKFRAVPVLRFKGMPISSKQFYRALSESDRRALALSLFWTKISMLDAATKRRMILVLDDPVTSFDDDRVSITMNEIRSAFLQFRQVILLTHYSKLVRHMLVNMKLEKQLRLLSLFKTPFGTRIDEGKKSTFIDSKHQQQYKKIKAFISGECRESIPPDLRVFLEHEVRSRYQHAIFEHELSDALFGSLINQLCASGAMTQQVAESLRTYIRDLNVAHHEYSNSTAQNWANLAENMLEFIYSEL